MFLHLLDRPQRRELLRAAQLLARVDAVLDLREEALLERMRAELGADDLPASPRDLDDVLEGLEAAFEDRPSRRVLLVELLRLVVADDAEDDEELEVIAAVCRRLDLSRGVHARARDVARRINAVESDALDLIRGADPASAFGTIDDRDA